MKLVDLVALGHRVRARFLQVINNVGIQSVAGIAVRRVVAGTCVAVKSLVTKVFLKSVSQTTLVEFTAFKTNFLPSELFRSRIRVEECKLYENRGDIAD